MCIRDRCTTDSTTCCSGALERAGEFYFPDGTQVPVSGGDVSRTYYRSRGTQLIRLNRRSSGTVTGQFRCEIPDASGTLVNLFINVGMYLHACSQLSSHLYLQLHRKCIILFALSS